MWDLEKEHNETGNVSSPDMDAAQHSEEQPQCEGHGNGQQGGQQPVEEELDQLEGGVAPNPNSVEAVGGARLADHVLETHLLRHHDQSRPKSEATKHLFRALKKPAGAPNSTFITIHV